MTALIYFGYQQTLTWVKFKVPSAHTLLFGFSEKYQPLGVDTKHLVLALTWEVVEWSLMMQESDAPINCTFLQPRLWCNVELFKMEENTQAETVSKSSERLPFTMLFLS